MSEVDASSVVSHASSVSQLDQYIRDQGLEEGPPVSTIVTNGFNPQQQQQHVNLDNLLATPSSISNNLSALASPNASFGVTTSVKKRAAADHPVAFSVLLEATSTPKGEAGKHLTLDSYLGTDDSDSDSNNDGNFISNPKSPLSVSSDSFHELNTSARHRTASYNMKYLDDLKRKKINYPETKLHDAYLIKPKENRDETNAEQIEGEAMDRLATSYGPVVRSSLLNSSSLPPSTDPDAILRRLRDQHNLRRRSLKSLVDLNYDLDVPEGDSDCDGDGGSYGGYFNESMERGDGDELDDSFDINPKTNSNPKRVNLAKVNASIQEVLRTRTRGSRGGGTLLKAITSGNNTENNFDSPSSVASEVEAEIKRSREAAEQQQKIMGYELQRAKEKEEREEQERNEEEARLKREEEERADLSNWVLYFDESNQHHYYFNPVTEESLWQEDAPEEVVQAVNEKGKNMAQAASMAAPPPKPPTSPLPNNSNNNNSTNNNVSPLPLFSPTKLIRNFNESYGINEAAGTLLAKPHDPLAQVANTLQTIVTQFAEFSQTQQSHFEQQRREQQKAALNSTINLSLARPAAGQFEDLEEGEGEGSDMGDITGVSAIAQGGEEEEVRVNVKVERKGERGRTRAQTEPVLKPTATNSDNDNKDSKNSRGPRGFSSPPVRKGRGRANPIPPAKPNFGNKDPNAPPIIEIVEPDPNPPLLTKILSQTTLPQYEQVENELVKEEWIKEAGGVGSGVCSGTQTDYISEFDDSSVSMFVDKVISVSAAVVGVNSSTQVSPGKGRRDGGKKVTMVDAYSGRSPHKTVRITVSPHSGHSGKKKKETGVSTSIYISPLKLSLARKILCKILSSYLRLAFLKWRVTSIPPTGITSAPTAVNPQTAALESVSENCIFALRSRITTSNSVLVSVDEGSSLMPTSPDVETPMLSMLVETGEVRDSQSSQKFDDLERLKSGDILPDRIVSNFSKSEYAEPVKMNFEGMGLYVPSSMSVGGSPGVRVASPLKSKSSISIGPGTISNSLMPLEYQRALSGLKARYGAGAPVDMKIFGVGGTIEPSFCLAIPPAEKEEERVETIVGSMSVKIADLTVNGLINSGDDVRSEIMKGREELRDVTVKKVVEDKALIRLRGMESKESVKWLSSPPSKLPVKRREEKAEEKVEERRRSSPSRSPSRSLMYRSPLRSLSNNYNPPSVSSFENCESIEALNDLKNKIKTVESDLKTRRLGGKEEGGFQVKKFKDDLKEIKDRRMKMRTGGIAQPIKENNNLKGQSQTLFNPDYNFASALIRNIQSTKAGRDVDAKKLVKLIASPTEKFGNIGGRFKLKTEELGRTESYNLKPPKPPEVDLGEASPFKEYNFGFLEDKDGKHGFSSEFGREDDVSTITRGD